MLKVWDGGAFCPSYVSQNLFRNGRITLKTEEQRKLKAYEVRLMREN